jgi:hypothetical protein
MNGVKVKITQGNFPTPFGLEYEAKGAYLQGKYIVVVGNLKDNSTIRIKYPKDNCKLEFF